MSRVQGKRLKVWMTLKARLGNVDGMAYHIKTLMLFYMILGI